MRMNGTAPAKDIFQPSKVFQNFLKIELKKIEFCNKLEHQC